MRKHSKLIILFIVIAGIALGVLSYAIVTHKISFNNDKKTDNTKEETNKDNDNKNDDEEEEEPTPPPPPAPKLKIIDLDSKTRPIAIMVDNESGAWPHAGLQDAFLIYEIIIEGGQSRLLAIFKDKDTNMIGPIRSARHYFLDYAMENDAIYTHFGFSPQAQSDIKTYGINNISGTQADGSAFWREPPLGGWHNVFTKISNLMAKATAKGYRTTSDATPLLNYSVSEIDPTTAQGAVAANNIRINYSSLHYVSYQYDPTTKLYKRFMRNNPHVDRVTGAQYTFKNIITYKVRNYPLNDGSGKGRQGLENVGSGDGYYITDGYAIPIKWEKTDRTAKTIYKDLAGNEIKVNDGNTIINIEPQGQTITISQ